MTLANSHSPGKSRTSVPTSNDDRITIGEMARVFNLSLRTLRFYEDRGLLVPRREGTTRYYAARDKARMELILKGKHLGFTLTEIREFLVDADKRPESQQLALRHDQILAQLAHLEKQRSDIDRAILELRAAQAKLEESK